MATLSFNAADVRRVVEHAIANSPAKGATILFVHDQGVYLMSGAKERDIVQGETSFCAFAKGMDPDKDSDWWDAARDAVGGDDFGETLPHQYVASLKKWLDDGAVSISIKMTTRSLKIEPRFGRGKAKHIKA